MKHLAADNKIVKLLNKNKTDKAIDILTNRISKNENKIKNSLILSEIYLIKKDTKSAINALENLKTEINKYNTKEQYEIYSLLGEYYFKLNNYDKSFRNYARLIKTKINEKQTIYKLILIYIKIKNFKKAEKLIVYLIKKEPNDLDIKSLTALYYFKKGKIEDAKDILDKIISINPNHHKTLFYKGLYYFSSNDLKNAEKYFIQAKRDTELKIESYYYLGKIEIIKMDRRKAAEYFKKALQNTLFVNNLTLDIKYRLAICFEELKDYNDALNQLRDIYKINENYKDIKEKLISENYKNVADSYLNEYNSFSHKEFIDFNIKLLEKFNLKLINQNSKNENLMIAETHVNKINIFHKLLKVFINYSKKEKYILIFSRCNNITEHFMEDIVKKINFKIKKGLLFTATDISPLAIQYASKKKIKVISKTFFNNIIKNIDDKNEI